VLEQTRFDENSTEAHEQLLTLDKTNSMTNGITGGVLHEYCEDSNQFE
jgi:hypothetical protein